MNNKELEQGFNQSVGAKKTNRLAMILIASVCTVITVTCLIFYLISNLAIAGKVKVVDTRGVVMKTELVRESQLIKTGIQAHITDALFYANSFDRETIKSNQNRALFLIDKESAFRIFQSYKKQGIYNDALKLGHIYRVEKTEVTHLSESGEPYSFKAKSILVSKDGARKEYFSIISQGIVTFRTPSFPNNSWGLWITDYSQSTNQIVENE